VVTWQHKRKRCEVVGDCGRVRRVKVVVAVAVIFCIKIVGKVLRKKKETYESLEMRPHLKPLSSLLSATWWWLELLLLWFGVRLSSLVVVGMSESM
jgi:hypothetical protein